MNLHIDLQTVVMVFLVITVFYRPLLRIVFLSVAFLETKIELPTWADDLLVGVAANVLAALFIIPTVFWVFRLKAKSSLCGAFKAYDVKGEEDEYWGDVSLTYNIFSNRIRGRLRSGEYDADIFIEAVFERGEYLRGHYVEKKKVTKRRMGAFLLMLDGEGDSYSGRYVFVDPCEHNYLPQEGRVKWVKEPTS